MKQNDMIEVGQTKRNKMEINEIKRNEIKLKQT